jgi:hypothetical protein
MKPGNIFVWILVAFPVYLLVTGKLVTYLQLANPAAKATP